MTPAARDSPADAANNHCAYTEIANLLAPDRAGEILCAGTGDKHCGQVRAAVKEESREDRDSEVPGNCSADKYEHGNIKADNITDADQRR